MSSSDSTPESDYSRKPAAPFDTHTEYSSNSGQSPPFFVPRVQEQTKFGPASGTAAGRSMVATVTTEAGTPSMTKISVHSHSAGSSTFTVEQTGNEQPGNSTSDGSNST